MTASPGGAGDFGESKKFAVVDGFLTKLESSARTSNPRFFVESIFPAAFGMTAMESFMESQESYLALFENQANKAAHVNVMSEEEASSCYQSIITKPDTYVYNAEIAGAILELFCKIDGAKLANVSNQRVSDNKPVSVTVGGNLVNGFSIGQIVELENLEVTSKGVLRGMIAGSTVGASLSKSISPISGYIRDSISEKKSL